METELKLAAVRLGENDGYSHLPDKGPWAVRRPGASSDAPTITRLDGSVVGSNQQVDDLPSAHRYIFSDLINDISDYARAKKVTVHLFNDRNQLLLCINPQRYLGLYEESLTVTIAGGLEVPLAIKHEDDRPLCPVCGEKTGLEPGHWPSKLAEWRWVCVACDYAVKCDKDNMFSPTGELASRGMRRTRAKLQEVYSRLWKLGLMDEKAAYGLLKEFFPPEPRQRVNFATMNVLQMQEAADFAKDLIEKRFGDDQTKQASTEMKELYTAIAHEEGEPAFLGGGVYLFPNGRVGEL